MERAYEAHAHAVYAIYEAIVFSLLAVEGLLNEQAYNEIHGVGNGSALIYGTLDRGAQGFARIQAVLTYFYGSGLRDGENPANDLKHLIQLRNGLVHYRFDEPPAKALDDLAQRGLLNEGWRNTAMVSWPAVLTKEVARWAQQTACRTALAIADLLPGDPDHQSEAALIRNNFGP